jgi:hypothetical protein
MSTPRNDAPAEGQPSDHSRRLWDLFDQAVDLPPAAQRVLLDAACATDPGLRAQLEQLLAHDARLQAEDGPDFLQSPLRRAAPEPRQAADPATLTGAPPPSASLGHYRVLRLLGQGGMGTVYEAEQDNPRRRVALKVLRPGLLTPALLKRFGKEAQILGRLHHPRCSTQLSGR